MYISAAVFTAGYLLMVCAQDVIYLYIGRSMCGIASGLVSVSGPTYVAEIASPHVRGLLGSCFQVSFITFLKVRSILESQIGFKNIRLMNGYQGIDPHKFTFRLW